MIGQTKPFLWKYMKNVSNPNSVTGGEERPLTASANEENNSAVVDLSFFNTKIVNNK